jgi:hypothetical protein
MQSSIFHACHVVILPFIKMYLNSVSNTVWLRRRTQINLKQSYQSRDVFLLSDILRSV